MTSCSAKSFCCDGGGSNGSDLATVSATTDSAVTNADAALGHGDTPAPAGEAIVHLTLDLDRDAENPAGSGCCGDSYGRYVTCAVHSASAFAITTTAAAGGAVSAPSSAAAGAPAAPAAGENEGAKVAASHAKEDVSVAAEAAKGSEGSPIPKASKAAMEEVAGTKEASEEKEEGLGLAEVGLLVEAVTLDARLAAATTELSAIRHLLSCLPGPPAAGRSLAAGRGLPACASQK
jgi:hypothetical protein